MFARHLEATIALLNSRDEVNAIHEAEGIDPSIALALPRLIGVAVVARSVAVAAVSVTVPTTLDWPCIWIPLVSEGGARSVRVGC